MSCLQCAGEQRGSQAGAGEVGQREIAGVEQRLAQQLRATAFGAGRHAPFVQAVGKDAEDVFLGDADGAVHRMRRGRTTRRRFAGAQLGGGRMQRIGQQRGGAAHARADGGGDGVLGQHGEFLLHGLELADGLAELAAVVGVGDAQRQHPGQRAGHGGGVHGVADGFGTGAGADEALHGPGRTVPAQRGRGVRAEGARRPRGSGHGQQQPIVAGFGQHVGRKRCARYLRADDCAALGHGGLRQRDAAAVGLPAGLRQQRAGHHGLAEGVVEAGLAGGHQQREGVGQRQAHAALLGAHQRVGKAKGVDLGPQFGGVGAAFDGTQARIGAQRGQRALEFVGNSVSHVRSSQCPVSASKRVNAGRGRAR